MSRGPLVRRRGRGRRLRDDPRPRVRPRRSPPTGCSDRLSGLAVGARMFRDEVAQGMAEKETELRDAARSGRLMGHPSWSPASTGRRPTETRAPRRGRQHLMDTAEIRRRFVAHFENTPSARTPPCPSASLLLDDPNLLFVNAGMVPFKPYFLGQETPPYDRARSACRSACAPPTSRTSARPPGTARSSRCAATSPSATTSRKAPSSWPGTWSPSRRPTAAGASRRAGSTRRSWHGDDEALRAVEEGHRPARRADRPARARRRTTGRWACPARAARARRSSTTAARARPRRRARDHGPDYAREARGPLPGDLEPGLHAGRAQRGAVQGGLRHRRLAAEEEHRHRHGPRAGRVPAPGQARTCTRST